MDNSTSKERLHALDALRAFAMLLGITLHAAIAYQVLQWIPWVESARKSIVFDIHNVAVHAFRLQLFFLIAGFFARLSWERHGRSGFVRNRAQRVLLPFLLVMITLNPLTGLLYYFGLSSSMPYTLHLLKNSIFLVTGQYWFLEYLLIYYLLVLLLVPLAQRAGIRGNLANELFRKSISSRWKPLTLGLLTLAWFSFSTNWADVGLPIIIVPIPHIVAYYGTFFLCGWLLHRNADLLPALRSGTGLYAAISILLLGVLLSLVPLMTQFEHPYYEWLKAATMLTYNVFTWTAIFALTGAFLRWFNKQAHWTRYLADASYWFYLAHLPVVLALQYALRETDIPALLQFVVVVVGTVAFCAASYHCMVRYTWIGRTLNGPREKPVRNGPLLQEIQRA